jgi:hypothetical protein
MGKEIGNLWDNRIGTIEYSQAQKFGERVGWYRANQWLELDRINSTTRLTLRRDICPPGGRGALGLLPQSLAVGCFCAKIGLFP